MLTALILVCSLATVSNDCTRDNALDVVYVPATFDSPVTCMMHAQAYVADSSIGRDLPQNEAVKVICVRGPTNRVDTHGQRCPQLGGAPAVWPSISEAQQAAAMPGIGAPMGPGARSEAQPGQRPS